MISLLQAVPECTGCGLHKVAKENRWQVGMPTHKLREGKGAVILLGLSPGLIEATGNDPLAGRSHKILRDYYVPELPDDVAIYLMNVVRCCTQDNVDPVKSEIEACNLYRQAEVKAIVEEHEKVAGVGLGASAAKHGGGWSSLRKARQELGVMRDGVAWFPAYHPGYIARFPEDLPNAVMDLRVVRDWFIQPEYEAVEKSPPRRCPWK